MIALPIGCKGMAYLLSAVWLCRPESLRIVEVGFLSFDTHL